jgi:hypothetical protein
MRANSPKEQAEEYIKSGLGDLLVLAGNYNKLLSHLPSANMKRKKAEKIRDAVMLLDDHSPQLALDYKNFSEHILTPEAHRAVALLRRERGGLKGSADRWAQDLYQGINEILPLFYYFHNEERRRRRVFIQDLPKWSE